MKDLRFSGFWFRVLVSRGLKIIANIMVLRLIRDILHGPECLRQSWYSIILLSCPTVDSSYTCLEHT